MCDEIAGADTYIGRTATLMNMTADQGHFQKVINNIGNFLIWITAVLVTTIFVYQVVKFKGTKEGDVLVILQSVLVLTVAAIPVSFLYFIFCLLFAKTCINFLFVCSRLDYQLCFPLQWLLVQNNWRLNKLSSNV